MASSPQFHNFFFHIIFTVILGYGEAVKYGKSTTKCDTGKAQQVNPSDLHSFIKCAAGNPIVFNCPPGTWFHPKLEVCVWERDYPIDGGKGKVGQSSKGGKGNGGNSNGGGKGNGNGGGNGYTGQNSNGGKGNGGHSNGGGQIGNGGQDENGGGATGNGIRGPDYGVYPDSYEGSIEDDVGGHGQGQSGGFSNGGGYGSLGGSRGGNYGATYGGEVVHSQMGEYDNDIRSHKIVRRALDVMSGLHNANETTYFLNDNDLHKKHLDYEISEITSNHIGGDIVVDDQSFKLTNISARQNPGNSRFPLGNRLGNRPGGNNRQGNRRPVTNGNFNIFRPNSAGGSNNQRPNNNVYGNFDRPNIPNGNDRPFDNGNNNMANNGNGNMDQTNNNGNEDNNNDNEQNNRPMPNAPCSMSGPLHTQYFQDPEDCSNYYTCNHGRMVLTFCPRGLHYIPERTRCEDWVPEGCTHIEHESPGITPVNETDENEK